MVMAEGGELVFNSSRYRSEAMVNSGAPLTHGCKAPRFMKEESGCDKERRLSTRSGGGGRDGGMTGRRDIDLEE